MAATDTSGIGTKILNDVHDLDEEGISEAIGGGARALARFVTSSKSIATNCQATRRGDIMRRGGVWRLHGKPNCGRAHPWCCGCGMARRRAESLYTHQPLKM